MDPLNIFKYDDYRIFLKNIYTHQKQNKSGRYSYKQFSKDIGLTASTYLYLVLQKKRNLSLQAIETIKNNYFNTEKQKKYFLNLVLLNQAKTKTEKEKHQITLNKILGKNKKVLGSDYDEYFKNWHIPVIREIVALKNFVSNLQWISKKLIPQITEDQIKKAFKILENLKMIHKQKGKWILTDEHLITPHNVSSQNVYNYHKEMLNLSLKSLEQPAKDREIMAMTLGISANQHNWLKEKIKSFVDDITQEIQDNPDNSSQVTQLNIQLFPLTHK